MLKLLDIFVRGDPAAMPGANSSIIPLVPVKGLSMTWEEWRAKSRASIYRAEKYPRDDPHGRAGHWMPWIVWRRLVVSYVTSAGRFTQSTAAMKLDLDFYFERPERLLTTKASIAAIMHTQKPDTDNLTKLVKDALTECGVWKDDCQVCRESVWKHFAARGDPAGCRIVVHQLEQEQPVLFDIAVKGVETPVHPATLLPAAPRPTYGRPGPRSSPQT